MLSGANLAVLRDADALVTEAALRIATLCSEAQAQRGRFTWALSGGTTPRQLYATLATAEFRQRIDWSRVEFFWGDERCVSPDHPESNYRMVRETLLDPIGADPKHVHRMRGEADPEEAAFAYAAELHRFFRIPTDGPPPHFDLVLLGMGADGHTASLFPGTPAVGETRRWVVPNQSPTGATRLTLTFDILNAAHHVLFLVSGVSKAEILRDVLTASAKPSLPAQRIQPSHGKLAWLVDAAAASRIEPVA